VHPQIKQEYGYSTFNDGNLPLGVAFKMHSGILPRQGGKSHEKQSQTLNKNKYKPIDEPDGGRVGLIGVYKHKQKSPMQLFAHLLQKSKVCGKT
jgi:hypothetical protein